MTSAVAEIWLNTCLMLMIESVPRSMALREEEFNREMITTYLQKLLKHLYTVWWSDCPAFHRDSLFQSGCSGLWSDREGGVSVAYINMPIVWLDSSNTCT